MTIWLPGPTGREPVEVRVVAVLDQPARRGTPGTAASAGRRADAQQPGREVERERRLADARPDR